MTTTHPRTAADLLKCFRLEQTIQQKALIEQAVNTARDYETARENLRTSIGWLMDTLEDALEKLDHDLPPNSLGVVQGKGGEVDRLCGELAQAERHAAAAQKLLETFNIR